MKIAILNNLYPPTPRGGALKIAQTTEKELNREGHKVIVITTDPKEKGKNSDGTHSDSARLHTHPAECRRCV